MKRIATFVALGAGLLMATPMVFAQPVPDKHDHRMKRGKRMKRLKVRGGKVMVRHVRPRTAPVGSTVVIIGRGFTPGMKVLVGAKHKVVPTSITPRRITFVVPSLPPSARVLSVIHGRKSFTAGMLTIGTAAATTTPTTARPDERRPRRRRWRNYRKRSVVFGMAPRAGRVGRRVVINGRNFAPDAQVSVNGAPVRAAKVTPRKIIFRMPPTTRATNIVRVVQASGKKIMLVGVFELKKQGIDKQAETRRKAEQARRLVEMRKLARARWMKRRAAMAKTRAARFAAYETHWKDLRARRAERRAKRLASYRAQWKANFLVNQQVRTELALHSDRMARLNQMMRLAEVDNLAKLVVRIQVAQTRETRRHKRRMITIRTALGVTVGGPQ